MASPLRETSSVGSDDPTTAMTMPAVPATPAMAQPIVPAAIAIRPATDKNFQGEASSLAESLPTIAPARSPPQTHATMHPDQQMPPMQQCPQLRRTRGRASGSVPANNPGNTARPYSLPRHRRRTAPARRANPTTRGHHRPAAQPPGRDHHQKDEGGNTHSNLQPAPLVGATSGAPMDVFSPNHGGSSTVRADVPEPAASAS